MTPLEILQKTVTGIVLLYVAIGFSVEMYKIGKCWYKQTFKNN